MNTITKDLRVRVWDANGGENLRHMKCYAGCGRQISLENFHCGHVVAKAKGGRITLDNLKPICMLCNSSMGTTNMHKYIKKCGTVSRSHSSHSSHKSTIMIDLTQDESSNESSYESDHESNETIKNTKSNTIINSSTDSDYMENVTKQKLDKKCKIVTTIDCSNTCARCNKTYAHRQSLVRHQKTCEFDIEAQRKLEKIIKEHDILAKQYDEQIRELREQDRSLKNRYIDLCFPTTVNKKATYLSDLLL